MYLAGTRTYTAPSRTAAAAMGATTVRASSPRSPDARPFFRLLFPARHARPFFRLFFPDVRMYVFSTNNTTNSSSTSLAVLPE